MPASDVFVTVIAPVGPLAVGGVFDYWLGRGWLGILPALAIGGLLTAGGLGIWYADAPSSFADCYECSEYWGRWMDETMFTIWLPLTVFLWAVGVVVGASRRRPGLRGEGNLPRPRQGN